MKINEDELATRQTFAPSTRVKTYEKDVYYEHVWGVYKKWRRIEQTTRVKNLIINHHASVV